MSLRGAFMALDVLDDRCEVLVLGIGNILWADEGFGPRSVERERQKFCVHGIIGARQTGASNEHEHQTQFS